MQRVLEPEVMDTAEEALEYDAMDHRAVNALFCEDLLACEPAPRRVVDVGTGTALIPIELCRRHPTCRIVAVDLAEHMLTRARANVNGAGFRDRIELVLADAKGSGLERHGFDVVMSNSIVHHIPDPARALADMLSLLSSGGLLFVRDLERPVDEPSVQRLVDTYAGSEAPKARALFEASLRAALTLGEVRAILAPFGVPPAAVERTSDRHWTLVHRVG
ncbi:MAG: class I SAM-dependent methyltransferase [Polyangiales bacterium]